MRVYHVTHTRLIPRIRQQGLRTLQPSNWINARGKRLGGGAIFAFEDHADALRWASKMDWGINCHIGSGKISILTLETPEEIWDPDFTDPLSQMGKVGRWLKAFQPIPASAILECNAFTEEHGQDLARALVSRMSPRGPG